MGLYLSRLMISGSHRYLCRDSCYPRPTKGPLRDCHPRQRAEWDCNKTLYERLKWFCAQTSYIGRDQEVMSWACDCELSVANCTPEHLNLSQHNPESLSLPMYWHHLTSPERLLVSLVVRQPVRLCANDPLTLAIPQAQAWVKVHFCQAS